MIVKYILRFVFLLLEVWMNSLLIQLNLSYHILCACYIVLGLLGRFVLNGILLLLHLHDYLHGECGISPVLLVIPQSFKLSDGHGFNTLKESVHSFLRLKLLQLVNSLLCILPSL